MRVTWKNLHRHGRIVQLPRRQAMGAVQIIPLKYSTSTCFSAFSAGKPSSPKLHPTVSNRLLSSVAPVPPEDNDEKEDSKDGFVKTIIEKQDVKVTKNKPWLLDLGLPSLIVDWRRMFNASTLFTDVSAGITVGCIAVPLSLAIAVASGVPPEVGLVTAAVSGVAGGLMGGTTLAITGPAAAISLLVVGAVTEHGFESLPFITLACGGLQLVSGVTRLGVWAKLVPVSVIAGFTTGVGTMILSGQVPKALGLTAPAGLNPIETVGFVGEHLSSINPSAAALAVGVSAAMFLLPKVHPKMPSALLAVGGATLATRSLDLDVAAIGSIPSGLEAFQWVVPTMPAVEALPSLGATIFLIYAMTSAESLLSCAALEKMKKTPYKHNPDQELIGQGLANMGAGMFTGMPVTSVIARSGLNVKLHAETRLPALVQAGFVFGSVVFFSDTISTIPMPALSGMLITTGIGMLNPVEFKHCFAVQKLDAIPFIATIGGMIAFGLAEGIGIGCLSAWALNYDSDKFDLKEMEFPHKEINTPEEKTKETKSTAKDFGTVETDNMKLRARIVTLQTDNTQLRGIVLTLQNENKLIRDRLETVEIENAELRGLFETLTAQDSDSERPTKSTIGWQLKGPINFGSMFKIDDLIHRIEEMKADEKVIVLDMQETTAVEFTGVEELVNRLVEVADQNPGTSIQMWNCHGELQNALQQCDPTGRIARHCSTISDEAPYQFPPKEEKPRPKEVPYWYDSPNFRPDA
jgi:MFS superfamily sulfate permease-like transporter